MMNAIAQHAARNARFAPTAVDTRRALDTLDPEESARRMQCEDRVRLYGACCTCGRHRSAFVID